MKLTKRDIEIVLAVYQYRLLASQQIEALFFSSSSSSSHSRRSACQRRLQLLYHHGYLQRIARPVVMGEGRAPFVYALDEKGAKEVASELGIDREGVGWRPKDNQVSALFLDHTLAINDVRVVFNCLSKNNSWQVASWIDDTEFRSGQMQEKVPFRKKGASIERIYPDGYLVLTLEHSEKRLHFFLEVDRATMSNSRWQGKIHAYVHFRSSGLSFRHFGTRNFRVLCVTTSRARLENLMRATEAAGGNAFFWFTTQQNVDIWTPEKLVEKVWSVVGTEGLHSFIT